MDQGGKALNLLNMTFRLGLLVDCIGREGFLEKAGATGYFRRLAHARKTFASEFGQWN